MKRPKLLFLLMLIVLAIFFTCKVVVFFFSSHLLYFFIRFCWFILRCLCLIDVYCNVRNWSKFKQVFWFQHLLKEEKIIVASKQWGSFFRHDTRNDSLDLDCQNELNTFWANVIRNHCKIAIPLLDYITGMSNHCFMRNVINCEWFRSVVPQRRDS